MLPSWDESGYVNEDSPDHIVMVDSVHLNGHGLFRIFFKMVDLMGVMFWNRGLVVFNFLEEH